MSEEPQVQSGFNVSRSLFVKFILVKVTDAKS